MGFYSRSNHFDSILVNARNSFVHSGTGIGTTGNTGWSTGAHVDYNIFFSTNTSNAIATIYLLNLKFSPFVDAVTGRENQYVNPENIYNLYR
jgi:murein DD-endopeptidase MepM/ murein hydrolase activator NlpD